MPPWRHAVPPPPPVASGKAILFGSLMNSPRHPDRRRRHPDLRGEALVVDVLLYLCLLAAVVWLQPPLPTTAAVGQDKPPIGVHPSRARRGRKVLSGPG